MKEWIELLWFFIMHPGLVIFALAMSGDFGFRVVQVLVKIYRWCDMTILDPDYIRLWIPLLFLAALALIPLYGIWFELRNWRKANENFGKQADYDVYDERIK